MLSKEKVILISAGDPTSISTEITIKAIESSNINKNINFILTKYNKPFFINVIKVIFLMQYLFDPLVFP